MTAVRSEIKLGKKGLPNKRLLYVLGAAVVLVIALKVVPGLLGGGGGAVAPVRSGTSLHLGKGTGVSSSAGLSIKPIARPSRDPFGAPPGY